MFRLTNGLNDLDGFKKKKSTSGNWGVYFSVSLKESEKPEKQH